MMQDAIILFAPYALLAMLAAWVLYLTVLDAPLVDDEDDERWL